MTVWAVIQKVIERLGVRNAEQIAEIAQSEHI